MKLSELQIGNTATICAVGGSGALRQHFLDMGLIQGTEVTVVKYAPMGDPIELRIHGYELTIRLTQKISRSAKPILQRRRSRRLMEHRGQKSTIQAMEREAVSTTGRRKIPCLRERPSPLDWWEIRTAERQRCSTS